MTPREQIQALMAAVANQPPDIVVPCKANKTHTLQLLVRWDDDLKAVPTAAFEIYRGQAQYVADMVVKGKFSDKKAPPGSYRVVFPDIDESELIEE